MTLTLSPILRRVVSTLQNSRWGKSRHADEVLNNGTPQEPQEERCCNVSPQDLQWPSTRSNACCKVGMTKQDLRRVLGSSAFMSFWVFFVLSEFTSFMPSCGCSQQGPTVQVLQEVTTLICNFSW